MALISLIAGFVFGAGLSISDMVNPTQVLNFPGVAGTCDQALIFVMAGALVMTAIIYHLAFARGWPLGAAPHPVAILGDMIMLEFNAPTPETIAEMQHRTGLPDAVFRSHALHAELEPPQPGLRHGCIAMVDVLQRQAS